MRVIKVGVLTAFVALCAANPCAAASDSPPAQPASQGDSSATHATATGAGAPAHAAKERVGSLSADEARRASRARKRAEASEKASAAQRHTATAPTVAHAKEEGRADATSPAKPPQTHQTATAAPKREQIGATQAPTKGSRSGANSTTHANGGEAAADQAAAAGKTAGVSVNAGKTQTRVSHKNRLAARHRAPRVGDAIPSDAALQRLPQGYGAPRYAYGDQDPAFLPRRRRFYYADPRFAPYPPAYPPPYRYAAPGYYPRAYYVPY